MKDRSCTVLSRMAWSYLLSSVLDMIAVPLHELADGVILGRLVSDDALSVIGLIAPIPILLFALKTMFVSGFAILAAKALGAGDRERASRLFTLAFVANAAVSVGLMLAAYAAAPVLLPALCPEPDLLPSLREYVRVAFVSYSVQTIISGFTAFVRVSGRPILVSNSVIVSSVLNVVLDLVFVKGFGMGLAGGPWATIVSRLAVLVMFVPYVRSGGFAFRLVLPHGGEARALMAEGLSVGVPNSVSGLIVTGVYLVTNRIIAGLQGEVGIFAWAALLQLMNVCEMICIGFSNLCQHVGGFLIGECDYRAVRTLVGRSLLLLTALLAVVALSCSLFSETVVAAFGMNVPSMASVAAGCLRTAVWLLVPFFICSFVGSLLIVVGRVTLGTVYPIFSTLCLVAGAISSEVWGPECFWRLTPLLVTAVTVALFLHVYFVHRSDARFSALALVPALPDCVDMCCTINRNGLAKALGSIRAFLGLCELGDELTRRVMLCSEELIGVFLGGLPRGESRAFFDIRIIDRDEGLTVVGKEFYSEFDAKRFDGSAEDIGLKIVTQLCEDIEYRRYNGVNICKLNFQKKGMGVVDA